MADRRELTVGGKPISSLRVVDLKVELEKRSLPKSGSKKDLLERLRLVNNPLYYRLMVNIETDASECRYRSCHQTNHLLNLLDS